ncbi:MAG: hypothetical protein K9K66_06385 [Desulfarculaceae bacterium]|nr:hypothetical protein [Desulfarculaceae bacterium]MCF8071131.1 hypothetical protein [Desulfarculaceae bacterium]MCF8101266.1 hypothetical protein [Desulfarculaceae bacterium]MCF8115185.1 hypothetical protein [Desulfarculaceae bacterium]
MMTEIIDHESAPDFCADHRRSSGRIHLPVAPRALARVRFIPDEPLPRALTPEQALNWLDYLEGQGDAIEVVNLNGPGDPLATPALSLKTLALVRERYPGVSLCLTSLGLGAAEVAPELAKLGLAHVSILMDAVDPAVVEGIYAWIRPGKRTLPLSEAAKTLVKEQPYAIAALVEAGVPVQIKTTLYPWINPEQIGEIAQRAAELGVSEMKLFPFLPKGDDCPQPCEPADPAELERLAGLAARHLPAQAVDLAACMEAVEWDSGEPAASQVVLPKPSKHKPCLAVCSSDGFEVDLHLGQAGRFLIYGPQDGPVVLLETRPAPEPGDGDTRWQQAYLVLSDCFAVLAAAAGESPRRILADKGLPVLIQEGNVEGLVDVLFGGGKKKGGKK